MGRKLGRQKNSWSRKSTKNRTNAFPDFRHIGHNREMRKMQLIENQLIVKFHFPISVLLGNREMKKNNGTFFNHNQIAILKTQFTHPI